MGGEDEDELLRRRLHEKTSTNLTKTEHLPIQTKFVQNVRR